MKGTHCFWKSCLFFHPDSLTVSLRLLLDPLFKLRGSNPATCPFLRVYTLPRRVGSVDLKLSLQSSVGVGSGEAVVTSSPHHFQLQLLGVPQT